MNSKVIEPPSPQESDEGTTRAFLAKCLLSLGAATTMLALPFVLVVRLDSKVGGILLTALMLTGLGIFVGGIVLRWWK